MGVIKMNFYLYAHGGSRNHGCEAIVRSTTSLFQQVPCKLFSFKPHEDTLYHLNSLCQVIESNDVTINKKSFAIIEKTKTAIIQYENSIPVGSIIFEIDSFIVSNAIIRTKKATEREQIYSILS